MKAKYILHYKLIFNKNQQNRQQKKSRLWRYKNGISLPGDEKYSRYFPNLANTYEDKEKPGMWGLTERQLDEASLQRRKEIEEVSKPNISFEDNTPRTPSKNVDRYRKLTQQYIENPDMDEVTRQALVKELKKGFELLSYYRDLYDDDAFSARDPSITSEIAIEADKVVGDMSNILSADFVKNVDELIGPILSAAKEANIPGILGESIPGISFFFSAMDIRRAILTGEDVWETIGENVGGSLGAVLFVKIQIATGGLASIPLIVAAAFFGDIFGSFLLGNAGREIDEALEEKDDLNSEN